MVLSMMLTSPQGLASIGSAHQQNHHHGGNGGSRHDHHSVGQSSVILYVLFFTERYRLRA